MLNVQSILVTVFVFAVTFIVPALVWITLAAGLFQIIYSRARWLGEVLSASRKPAQRAVQ